MWWWGWSKWEWQQNWLPHYFPSLTPRYVQVSGQHASRRRGTHFPTLLSLPPRRRRMVQRRLPTPWSFSSGVFVAAEMLQINALTPTDCTASATKTCNQRIPNLIRKEYKALGKYNFSWDSRTAMTWIIAVCWWHPSPREITLITLIMCNKNKSPTS